MFPSSSDPLIREVLRNYPNLTIESIRPLGSGGGLSGAWLWRVAADAGPFCLKAWPPGDPSPERLGWIHDRMAAAELDFVPGVRRAAGGRTWITAGGRLWDLTAWMPGRADFRERPTPQRLAAACTALARLHLAWAPACSTFAPCSGVGRRLTQVNDWLKLRLTGWQPDERELPPGFRPLVNQAWLLVRDRFAKLPELLAPWAATRPLPAQPCLCDVWHDHVLFEGDAVSGLIDYGGLKVDHVAVDLARILGSLAGRDAALRSAGLEAYVRVRPLVAEEEALVRVLDLSGTVLGTATWVRWLCRDRRTFDDPGAVVRRLEELLSRVDVWKEIG
jgi:Ser/Thr protein kinase RdoA (MazF antagonist)